VLAVAALIGITGGLLAGYYGGWFDAASSWIVNLIMALPAFVVLLAAIAVIGPSLWLSMIIFGVLMSPGFFRLVHASVRGVRNELYIDAASVFGLSDARIIGRHVLGAVRAPALIQAAHIAAIAIAIQSGLEFLGLGDPSLATWGGMLEDGYNNMYTNAMLLIWPGTIIALTCIAFSLLANALRDELEGARTPGLPRRTRAVPPRPAVVPPPSHDENAVLRVTDLAVRYPGRVGDGPTVVDGVSLTIRRGEVHGLVGESGSGKTQTAWAVLGLLPAGGQIAGGSIRLGDRELVGLSERELSRLRGTRIAYVPQEPMSNLDPSFRVGSQLVEPMRVAQGLSKKVAVARALQLLGRVGIEDPERVFRSYPHELSGGMAQRVLIAGAVSATPDLLIADEPTTALDVTVQADVLDLLRDLQHEYGMAILLVTHNFGVVADICDRVSVMRAGRIVGEGPVQQIFADPQEDYTRMLLDAIIDESQPRGPYAADLRTNEFAGGKG